MTLTLTKPTLTFETKIAVLCGGPSSEAEVSRRSGKNCSEALKRLGYTNTVLIEADQRVAYRLIEEDIEVVFIALHGKWGEDGAIQGLLDITGIPYTGSRLAAMSLTIDKDRTKSILKAAGLPIAPSITLTAEAFNTIETLMNKANLTLPVMIKPLSEGSSVGMSKATTVEELKQALELAGQYSTHVMVEAFITGKDLTVGIIEQDGKERATPILELRSKTGWYDFEAKYTKGLTEFILPAEIDAKATQQVQQLAIQAHQAAGCCGVSRVDFVYDTENNQPYILEINTIPGMTDVSDLPAQAAAMGMSYDELVHCILKTAQL